MCEKTPHSHGKCFWNGVWLITALFVPVPLFLLLSHQGESRERRERHTNAGVVCVPITSISRRKRVLVGWGEKGQRPSRPMITLCSTLRRLLELLWARLCVPLQFLFLVCSQKLLLICCLFLGLTVRAISCHLAVLGLFLLAL